MFYAMLIACHTIIADACLEVKDNRGPYLTEKRCEERIDEMIKDTVKIWLDHNAPVTIKGWKCERNVSAT
jgi:hypothetical protein|tara:strand:- start:885 stop:1094 length:210 start_codon:yes stop_codon:yes gene_type:complete